MNKPQRRPWWPNATQTLLLPFLLLLLPNHARSLQRIVEEPEDTVARLGETVVLKCRVQDQKGQVTWQKGDLGLGPHRDLPYWDRMSMVGSLGDGDFHLEIRNVSLDDEETYQCQLSAATEEEPAILSRRARLNVIVEPQGPVLLGESIAPLERSQPIATTEGQPIRLSCQSRAGKPPAQLGWAVAEDWQAQQLLAHIDNGTAAAATASRHAAIHPMRVREHSAHRISQRLVGNITELVDFDENSELHTVTSHLTFSPTKVENGRWLVCLASHPSYGRESRTASVELDVFYSPKVRVEVDMASSQLREGGHAKLRCLSDARPSEQLKFSWHWDGETKRLEVLDSKTALIAGLRFNDHGRRVSCTVENSLGPGSGVLELDVPYGPRFMSTNQTKTVDRGSEVNFQCEVLGNPAPTVRWYHGRDWETAVYEGKNFTIRNVQDWEEGQYRCTAHVDGFPPQTLYHMLYLKGPPRVNFGEFFVSDGGSKLTLVCTVQSRALPVRVHWLHNGHRVDIEHSVNADRYRVRDEKTSAHELISRLEIAGFNHDDFGLWNCSAKNEFGLVWDQRDIQLLGIMEKLSVELGKLQSWQIVAFFSLLAALILLPVAVFCCIRSCCRSKGHSKLSNHSSDPRGDFSVKCEELDGCLSNGPTPPFHAQPFYPEPLQPAPDYLSEPQYNPDMDRSVLLNNYGGNGQSLSAAGVLMDSASAQQQHFNNYLGGGLPPDPYGGTFDGVVLTNFAGVPTDVYDPSMVNSFGVQRLPFPGQQQQQHFYGYGGPSPLEPVTEVCTPESGEGPQAPGDGMERTLSRISSHV